MHDSPLSDLQKNWHATVKSYLIGFICSLILTFTAFFLVYIKAMDRFNLLYIIVTLGLCQAIIQLIFFFHVLSRGKESLENLILVLMGVILVIIVAGTLWVMYNLDERTMSHMNHETSMEHKHD